MGSMPGIRIGAAALVEAAAPTSASRSCGAVQVLAGLSIEHVEERVAVGHDDERARAAAEFGVDQHRNLVRIPVVHVVRRELEMTTRSLPVSTSSATSDEV